MLERLARAWCRDEARDHARAITEAAKVVMFWILVIVAAWGWMR